MYTEEIKVKTIKYLFGPAVFCCCCVFFNYCYIHSVETGNVGPQNESGREGSARVHTEMIKPEVFMLFTSSDMIHLVSSPGDISSSHFFSWLVFACMNGSKCASPFYRPKRPFFLHSSKQKVHFLSALTHGNSCARKQGRRGGVELRWLPRSHSGRGLRGEGVGHGDRAGRWGHATGLRHRWHQSWMRLQTWGTQG